MNRLFKLRTQRKLSQQTVANVLGVTSQAYGHYENDRRNIDNDSLKLLAEYFDVSTDYILGHENKTPIENNQSVNDFINSLKWDNLTDDQRNALARLIYGAEVERLEKEKKKK